MGTLRVAFLSGTVLELAATLGIALVAVTVGVRLVDGEHRVPAGPDGPAARARAVPAAAQPRRAVPRERRRPGGHRSAPGAGRQTRTSGGPRAPGRRRARPRSRSGSRASASSTRTATSPSSTDVDLTIEPGETVALTGAERRRQEHADGAPARPRGTDRGTGARPATSTSPTATPTRGGAGSPGCRSRRPCFAARSPTTSGSALPVPPTTPSPRRFGSPAPSGSSTVCPPARRRRSATAAGRSRPGSASASASRGRSSGTPISSSSTSPRRTSTRPTPT